MYYKNIKSYENEFQGGKISLVAMDTDSFFLEINNINLNKSLIPAMIRDKILDTSNYSKNNPLYNDTIKGKIGTFKDESQGLDKYIEWVM